ncbi:hypothetical protein Hokovirus_3_248 [Hokovirus HKV1]|uniref:Uncharacterized protein n=1 Tax=Hokovirus HKV1 TaxID=1977638 RepID=A0A1V0SGX5_9VIRU|nr:hypothetical protein Hokovirus_3_248 [Hokovirus HKV1]
MERINNPVIFNNDEISKELQLLKYHREKCNKNNSCDHCSFILTKIILIENVLPDIFYKIYFDDHNATYKNISPFVMLATENNFIKYVENSNILFCNYKYSFFEKMNYPINIKSIKAIFDNYLKFILTMYFGFIIYPNSKTQNILNKYYEILALYNFFLCLAENIDGIFRNRTMVNCGDHLFVNGDQFLEFIELLSNNDEHEALLNNVKVNNSYELFFKKNYHTTVNNIMAHNDNIITKYFIQDFDYPELINIACKNCDYRTVLYLLEKNIIPTGKDLQSLYDNTFISSLHATGKPIINGTYTCYYDISKNLDFLKYVFKYLDILIPKFYNYKIHTEESFIDFLLNILKSIYHYRLGNNFSPFQSIHNYIIPFIEFLVNKRIEILGEQYAYKIILLLVHNKNNICKNIEITEEMYYQIYKFYNFYERHIDVIYIDNFTNPIHIMRNMCFNRNTSVSTFKKFIKDNNVKPDRYCFEFASCYNNKIEKWLLNNKCLPTVRSLGYLSSQKRKLYLQLLVDDIQTQEYMCKPYEF